MSWKDTYACNAIEHNAMHATQSRMQSLCKESVKQAHLVWSGMSAHVTGFSEAL